jgi:hypothetical protein
MNSGSGSRRTNEQQASYTRQAMILRKNLSEWDRMLNTPRGEDWTTMLGRLNAAHNQTINLNSSIDDIMEHFVYVPKRSTANPQDIPFFLSTRLETPTTTTAASNNTTTATSHDSTITNTDASKAAQHLMDYEKYAAQLVEQYEENMVRF